MTQKHMNIVMCLVILIGAIVALMESGRTDRLQARVAQLETIAVYHVETINSLIRQQQMIVDANNSRDNSIESLGRMLGVLKDGVMLPKKWDGGTVEIEQDTFEYFIPSIPASSDTAPQESRSIFSDSGTVESSTSHTPVR